MDSGRADLTRSIILDHPISHLLLLCVTVFLQSCPLQSCPPPTLCPSLKLCTLSSTLLTLPSRSRPQTDTQPATLIAAGPSHIHAIDPASQAIRPVSLFHRQAPLDLAFLRPANQIASFSPAVGICLHAADTGVLQHQFKPAHAKNPTCFAVASAAPIMVVGDDRGAVHVVSALPSGLRVIEAAILQPQPITALALGPTGALLVAAFDQSLVFCSLRPCKVLRTLALPAGIGRIHHLQVQMEDEGLRLVGAAGEYVFSLALASENANGMPPTRDRATVQMEARAAGLRGGRLPSQCQGQQPAWSTDRLYVPGKRELLVLDLSQLAAVGSELEDWIPLPVVQRFVREHIRGPAAAVLNSTAAFVMVCSVGGVVDVALTRSTDACLRPAAHSLGPGVLLSASATMPALAFDATGQIMAVAGPQGDLTVFHWQASEEGQHQLQQIKAQAAVRALAEDEALMLEKRIVRRRRKLRYGERYWESEKRSLAHLLLVYRLFTQMPDVSEDVAPGEAALVAIAEHDAEEAALAANAGQQFGLLEKIKDLRSRVRL